MKNGMLTERAGDPRVFVKGALLVMDERQIAALVDEIIRELEVRWTAKITGR